MVATGLQVQPIETAQISDRHFWHDDYDKAITGKKAGFKSLGDTWADTTSHGRLMLTVLAGLAEFERDLIRARTGEGRARAVERGQKMGRPFKLTDHQKGEAIKRRDQGETLADIARSYNVSPATISRLTT